MDTNKESKDKNFEQLKNEFDTMRKLFDNLNSKNKIKPKTDKPDIKKSSEFDKIDKKVADVFFKENKLPDLTPEEKSLIKNTKAQTEDTDSNLTKNIASNRNDTPIIIEFDNEELKIRNNEGVPTDKNNIKNETNSNTKELVNPIKEIEQTTKTVDKEIKPIASNNTKKEAPKDIKIIDSNTTPITHDTIKKEIVPIKEEIQEVKKIEPLKGETQESYLSIKEKLEKIKTDIKNRELLKNQNTTTQNIINKIAEKQKSTTASINAKSSNTKKTIVPISKKVESPIKKDIEQKKKVAINQTEPKKITKPTIQPKPIQKKEIIKVKESNIEVAKKTQEVNIASKTNTKVQKEEKKSSGVLSIIILALIIIALLVFWVLFIQ